MSVNGKSGGDARRQILAAACALLAGWAGGDDLRTNDPLTVRIRWGGARLKITAETVELAAFLPTAPPDLSPIEVRVLSVLTDDYQDAKVIVRLAGRSRNYVRAALRALCERGLAQYFPRHGYRRAREPDGVGTGNRGGVG